MACATTWIPSCETGRRSLTHFLSDNRKGGGELDEKSIIIIGAGLPGLSAGCYGQMNKSWDLRRLLRSLPVDAIMRCNA